ncbi:porin [Vibrio cholerae]|nr:porin [Vibrio cholerae]EJL6335822.1 porin [Vibrio cholerae]EKF9573248.1 porin [Vibrio cholerae]EMA3774202.1 porin [Vibrio cholerae]
MKKTLLALAVAGLATSAQASVQLYKGDTSSVSVKGEIATYLYTKDVDHKDPAKADEKTDADVNAWAKVQFDFSHQVTDTLVAGGTFEIQSGTKYYGNNNDAEFDDVAAYLKGDFGTLGLGEIGDVSDSNNAVSKTDILNELDTGYLPVSASDSKGHGVSYTKKFDALTFVVDAYTESSKDKDNQYGVSLDYAADIFSVGAMYQYWGEEKGVYKDKSSAALSADVKLGSFTLATAYNVVQADKVEDEKNLTVSAIYAATEAVSLYGVAGFQDDGSSKDGKGFVLGASYAASNLLTVFTEVSSLDDHDTKDTTEILLGAYFDF